MEVRAVELAQMQRFDEYPDRFSGAVGIGGAGGTALIRKATGRGDHHHCVGKVDVSDEQVRRLRGAGRTTAPIVARKDRRTLSGRRNLFADPARTVPEVARGGRVAPLPIRARPNMDHDQARSLWPIDVGVVEDDIAEAGWP